MTPAAHHPALVAAVEALEHVIEAGVSVIPGSGVLPYLPQSLFKETSAALALLRAAMEKAETRYQHNVSGNVYSAAEVGELRPDILRAFTPVTVLRWEE